MPTVNARHRVYGLLMDRWRMVRDAVEGEVAVKASAEEYLPKLQGAKPGVYEAYIKRALFFEATRRTLQGLVGMVMQRAPSIEAKDDTKETFLKHLTKEGMSLSGFASVVLREVLMLNKYGILADLPSVIKDGSEPWLIGYTAESIINWDTADNVDGKTIFTRIVLEEEYQQVDPEDRFVVDHKDQWRVLELVDRLQIEVDIEASDGPALVLPVQPPGEFDLYRVQVWRRKKDMVGVGGAGVAQDEFILYEEFFPSFRGTAITRIPFVVVTAEDEDGDEQKPPMEGLASVNMSHYRSSADLEHGRHFTALPTPYVIGLSQDQELTIGSTVAWMVSGVNASDVKIGMLEFTGTGLGSLVTAMQEKESQMARLGARLLEDQKKAVESFETHKIKASGEQSILASVANGTSEGLNEALAWMTEWDPSLGEILVVLNTEFVKLPMEPTMLTALIGALQQGKMSFKTYFFNMQERGMYPPDHTEETELSLIDDEAGDQTVLELDDDELKDDEDEDKDEDKDDEEEE